MLLMLNNIYNFKNHPFHLLIGQLGLGFIMTWAGFNFVSKFAQTLSILIFFLFISFVSDYNYNNTQYTCHLHIVDVLKEFCLYQIQNYNLTFNSILFYFLFLFFVFNSLYIILSRNAITSLLFLISTYFYSSILLIVYQLEFFALLYVIIYVGGIAVLFLFVIMMLKFKYVSEYVKRSTFKKVTNLISFMVLSVIFFKCFNFNILSTQLTPGVNYLLVKQFNVQVGGDDLENLGLIFYTEYSYIFLICGIILLLSILAPILLTYKERHYIRQQNYNEALIKTKQKIVLFN